MRIDPVSLTCPKCRTVLDLAGDYKYIPRHFLDEQRAGVEVAYGNVDQPSQLGPGTLTYRKLCRLSGAEIVNLRSLRGGTIAP